MKHKQVVFIAITLLLLILLATVLYLKQPAVRPKQTQVSEDPATEQLAGVYDPRNILPPAGMDSVWHYRIKWQKGAGVDKPSLEKNIAAHPHLLLTIETWPAAGSNDNVLKAMLDGNYDENIQSLGAVLSRSGQETFVRWNPDMEVPVHQYPWQYQSPELYIRAFNYFAARLKKIAPNTRLVWAPAGYPGDSEYWPGGEEVDAVSITFDSPSELAAGSDSLLHLSNLDVLQRKLHRMRFMDKPVLILSANTAIHQAAMKEMVAEAAKNITVHNTTIYAERNFNTKTQLPARHHLLIGVFDPRQQLIAEPEIRVEHVFTDWGAIQRGEFEHKFNEVMQRHHDIIVTMEPWKDTSGQTDTAVLRNTVQGKYDREIARLYATLAKGKQQVYLRWAHEMEIPIHRYAWQSQDPVEYINSYRYFAKFNAPRTGNIHYVWGPAGDRGSADWYPGDDVVDYISIAIYGLPDKNITDPHQQESFQDIFRRKNYRMRFLNKPLFITEFGVKGSEDFQDKWLADAAKTILQNRHIFGICYFNLYDNPKAWGDIKAPDWSISKNSLKKFTDLLQ